MLTSVAFRVEVCGRGREEMGGGGRGVRFRMSSEVKRRSSLAKPLNYFCAGRVLHAEALALIARAMSFYIGHRTINLVLRIEITRWPRQMLRD